MHRACANLLVSPVSLRVRSPGTPSSGLRGLKINMEAVLKQEMEWRRWKDNATSKTGRQL